jgi:hypothetical protein
MSGATQTSPRNCCREGYEWLAGAERGLALPWSDVGISGLAQHRVPPSQGDDDARGLKQRGVFALSLGAG